MLRYIERYEPALVQEVRGVAAGAGVSFETAFHFNVSSPVHYIKDYQAALDAGRVGDGCTNVAFASTERGALLGKTNDGGAAVPPERQATTWVLQHAHPDEGTAFFLLAPVGALAGVAGLNAAGFAVGQSAAQVVRDQSGFGVPNNLILKALLERCETVGDALDLLESRDLAGKGLNLMLLDAAGTVRAAEKSASLLGVRHPDDTGLIYFTNHCHTDSLRDLPPRHDRDNSLRRWARLQDLFDRDRGYTSRDEATLRDVITTHGAGGICQHGPDMFTSLGILIAPRERVLRTSDGAPCSTPFVTHTFSQAPTAVPELMSAG